MERLYSKVWFADGIRVSPYFHQPTVTIHCGSPYPPPGDARGTSFLWFPFRGGAHHETHQLLQALRGRILQLEAELSTAKIVTRTIAFVGSCEGWHGSQGGIGTSEPSLGNASPTAHYNAKVEFTKWKSENPGAKIISEEFMWHGLDARIRPDNRVVMVPTCIILVKYRDA